MRVAIYARVSTDDQSSEMQIQELIEHIKYHKLILTKQYVDVMSGSKDSRPALNSLLEDAKRNEFDMLLVWKIDRLGRSATHLLNILTDLQKLNISFMSKQESIDTSTPMGKCIFTILASIAELERSVIIDRVKCGLANARRKGVKLGRPEISLPIKQMETLRKEGKSYREIAKQCNISHQKVFNYLRGDKSNVSQSKLQQFH